MGLFELTDAHRTIANSRVSLDETMIPMVTDKLFRIVRAFIFHIGKLLLLIAFLCFDNFTAICISNNGL